MIELAAHAESYISHQQRQQRDKGNNGSISHREYDVDESRREWSKAFN